MKRKIPLLFLLIFARATSVLFGQVQTLCRSLPFPTQIKPGDSVSFEITNSSSQSIAFYPLTVYDDTVDPALFLSNQNFFSKIEEIPVDQKMARINRLAYFVKSRAFKNNYLLTSDQDSLVAKKLYSVSDFCLGISQKQCGHYRGFFIWVLVQTGTFDKDSIFEVSLLHHQVAACIYLGDTILLDPDPGEPIFLNRGPNGEYLSPSQVVVYQKYVDSIYQYCDPVLPECGPLVSVGGDKNPLSLVQEDSALEAQYIEIFDSGGMTYSPSKTTIIPSDDSGLIRLPPHSSLKIGWHATSNGLTQNQFDTLLALYKTNDTAVVNAALIRFLGPDYSSELDDDDIIVGDSSWAQLILDPSYEKFNTLELFDTTGSDTVWIGQQLRMPFFINSVSATKDLVIGDTIYSAGDYSVTYLLNEKGDIVQTPQFAADNVTTAPDLSDGQVETLQSRGFIPPYDTVHFVLYYNERIFSFLSQGVNVRMLNGNADSLAVTEYQNFASPDLADTVPLSIKAAGVSEIKIYPNPTNGSITVENWDRKGPLVLYDMEGQKVLDGSMITSLGAVVVLSIKNVPSGIYFLTINSEVKQIVKF